jgi:AcrR family transcriptional regulator
MPKLWTATIGAHRRTVRDGVLNTTAALVAEQGLRGVTMSRIADRTGIGRATLYKYFPGVEAILLAWHDREIAGHLEQLQAAEEAATDPAARLDAVLDAYARIAHQRGRHDADLAGILHQDEHVARAKHRLHAKFRDLITGAVRTGYVRNDVRPDELAGYCLHALTAASTLTSAAAVRRLVAVTLAGLRAAPERSAEKMDQPRLTQLIRSEHGSR